MKVADQVYLLAPSHEPRHEERQRLEARFALLVEGFP